MADSRKTVWVLGLVTRYVPRQFYSSIPGWPQATMNDHAELLKGIQAHDPDATRAAMHQHIVHSGELLADHFDARVAAAEDAEETAAAG
jgi:DNA-binding FadR family transcriptional regulator